MPEIMMKTHSPKLLDRVRQVLRTQHDALDTEKADVNWIKRFIFFPNVRHPAEMGVLEIEAFLTDPAVNPGIEGPQKCGDNDDLHPRGQTGRHGRPQPCE